MYVIKTLLFFIATSIVLGVVFIYSGVYPMGADVPHNQFTHHLLETLREQSVKRAASSIEVPNLNDPDKLLMGGADYNDMCASCHLKPGKKQSDMSVGLYPAPPNLSIENEQDESTLEESSRQQFWIIKHGIKASGMPAWGPTHDDDRIWAMVAFLQKLPSLTEDQYQIITARGDMPETSHH